MYRSAGPIDRFAFGYELLRYLVVYLSRIAELGGDLFVVVQPRDIGFVRNDDRELFTALFALFRRDKCLHAGTRLFELAVIAMLVLCICELVRRADGVTDNLVRRRNLIGRREMIDDLGQELLVGRIGKYRVSVLLVYRLRFGCFGRGGLLGRDLWAARLFR